MLAIQLERSRDGFDGPRIGSARGLLIAGTSMRMLPTGARFMRLAGECWQNASESFVGLTIESPTLIYAMRSGRLPGRMFGPFDFVRLSHTQLYVSESSRITFATFNPIDRDWHITFGDTNWPRLVLYRYRSEFF